MRQVISRLDVDRSFMLIVGLMSLLLLLLLLIGWIWVMRLPPAPTVLPDPQALAPVFVALPESSPADFARPSADIPAVSETEGAGKITGADDALQSSAVSEMAADISSRPLFWPGRRPVVESDEPEVAATGRPRKDEFDKVKLVGVYFAGPASGVIVELDGERQRIRLQEELLDWKLEMLSANNAVFVRGEDKQKTLQLEHANSAKYTATAKPAAKKANSAESEEVAQ